MNGKYETHEHDVLIIGAGGAGLRAAIAALTQGASVGVVCKSLLGKAHRVMAEGGIAAAMANVDAADDWRTHFCDTMRGGKCFLCQNVCHVLGDHGKQEQFGGPRFFVRVAGLEMHTDGLSRTGLLKSELGIGFCNITKCCTEVCPEGIRITDNAIIPLKERVVDDFYDPVLRLVRKIRGVEKSAGE